MTAEYANGEMEQEGAFIATYHQAFLDFLGRNEVKEKSGANKARQKLLNLSMGQFGELSTDVYDELQRRWEDENTRLEHLPAREDLHPKRNQARQKLAILSATRFEDLSADIFYEIERRYPELAEERMRKDQEIQKQDLKQATIIPTKSELVEEDDSDEEEEEQQQPAARPKTLDSIAEETEENTTNEEEERTNNNNMTYNNLSGQITPPETVTMYPENGLSSDELDLRDQIKDRDEQIQMLVAEGSRMDESINKLEAQLSESEKLKGSLVEENSRLNKLVEELEGEKEQMNGELKEQTDRYEAEIARYQDQLRDTERKLADVEAENVNMRDARDRDLHERAQEDPEMGKKYQRLKRDHERLTRELEEQQKITDQVRHEASMFLEEMRTLASQEMDMGKLQELKVEAQEWKSRYMRAKSQVRDMRASTYGGRSLFQPSTAPIEKDSPYYDEKNGKIRDSSVTRFQIAMDEFLVKSRADSANILDNLHYLVVATRRVTQDITDGQSAERASDSEEQSQIAQCTSLVSTTANHLITTTRNHATSGGLAPMSVLDAAASDLSSAVIDLVKVAKVRPGSDLDNEETPPPRPNSYQQQEEQEQDEKVGLGISAEAGDTLSAKDDVPITVKKRFATANSKEMSMAMSNFDIADPDNTVAELQGYLEEKTVGVIDSIQSLLTGIRDNEIMSILRPHIDNITSSVNKMIEATGTSMNQTRNWQLKDKGQYILANLSDCSQRMANLRTDSDHLDEHDHPDRHLKQRLAGISFDMAKCTKELVKTVEEVSLNAEISQIDEQLR
ncbi:hypothetical protein TRICI_001977 [Trichomonascus ciferrii]|uniref:GIT Spa2 homology (SHD) domain-containing protein n=1 Tax=Trichomonascus ciferrii TaxID=44093 RepID=A0A642VCA9_9ASCO|nr:hypothetical protein TRICI_001977 [Trichomonascus ciferrii]